MTVTTTVKKVVTDYPYAALGATDLAVERVRTASARVESLRDEAPAKVQARISGAPAAAQKSYADLAARGEKLVERVRKQKATQDLAGQARATVALGKGLVTTARDAVAEVERSAKATLTIGRKEAAKAADAVAESVEVTVDTDAAQKAVKESAKRTRTAAKRTTTTAKKGATRTRSTAKSTLTSARKTAAKATTATEKAAEKVGD